jgi:7-carboxy-7-deazaguanine synthase
MDELHETHEEVQAPSAGRPAYSVKALFYTMQGEGSHAGRAAVFLRLAGCNLWNGLEEGRQHGKASCAQWCDTDFVGGQRTTAAEIVARMDHLWDMHAASGNADHKFVVVTGGEPALQLDDALVVRMQHAGWWVAVETNGTVDNPVLHFVDHVCVSPKRGSTLQPAVLALAHEIKVVLPGGWSTTELLAFQEGATDSQRLFVQPCDTPSHDATQEAVAWVLEHPRWLLSLQMHKALGLP